MSDAHIINIHGGPFGVPIGSPVVIHNTQGQTNEKLLSGNYLYYLGVTFSF